MDRILQIENLKVEYPSFTLGPVSFDISSGEIVGVIGENGAGKSTTIKAILGIVAHSGGSIRFKGEEITEAKIAKLRQRTGYVGDAELYYANLKVKQIGAFLADLYEDWDKNLMERYLAEFHISPEKKMKELSMGMRVKFEIAVALSHQADLYLLDEPTSGLDPMVRSQILKILKKLGREEGKAILFSSHITSDIDKIADRVIYLRSGKLLLDEGIENIRKNYIKIPMFGQLTFAQVSDFGGIITEDGIVFRREDLDESFLEEYGGQEFPVTTEDILFLLSKGAEL